MACSRSKIRCDGGSPCANCRGRNIPCTYSSVVRKRGPPTGVFGALCARLDALDAVLLGRPGASADAAMLPGTAPPRPEVVARVAAVLGYGGLAPAAALATSRPG